LTAYADFLESKRDSVPLAGFAVDPTDINPQLFDWQRRIVTWALARGKAALFEDCGLGKTAQALEWARHVARYTDRPVLILTPLAVGPQFAREGQKFGVPVTICQTGADVRAGVNVTNYERLHHFAPDCFGGIVADESSILKQYTGVTRRAVTEFAQSIPFRLSATATPAPNDLIELINQAEFLGVLRGKEAIALFFTQDGNTTHSWRLKGHARRDFWRWLATWAVALRRPSDLGYPDDGFVLPPLVHNQIEVEAPAPSGKLFATEVFTLEEQRAARRATIARRVAACAELVNREREEPWLVWCDLNDESAALAAAIPGAVEVRGSDSHESKEAAMLGFLDGEIRVLVSKPSIMGFGMNFQHCARMAFVGLSHSFEAIYQATRRCWRFGQSRPVHVYVFTSTADGAVVANIQRKERQYTEMMDDLVRYILPEQEWTSQTRDEADYTTGVARGRDWTLYLGDAVEMIDRIETESVGLTITSPPFPSMYAYTNSPRDMGNVRSIDEMLAHFRYLVGRDRLLRVTMPGRLCCVHLMQLTAMKSREGYVGLHDYRGRTIDLFQQEGWIYAGEVLIDKNPQVQATRNKERGLLFKTLATDSSLMRMALGDYLLYFRKPGDNPNPIRAGRSRRYNDGGGWITEEEWIEWAAPVWLRHRPGYPGGIRETDVLNVAQARETDDERHLCPLQLGVVERAVKLWSAPGDLVFDPFTGIGSVGYKALLLNRRFVGTELKESYWRSACAHLQRAEHERGARTLFDLVPEDSEVLEDGSDRAAG
jgi:DNA modification methylase